MLIVALAQIAAGLGLFWYRVRKNGEAGDLLVLYSPMIAAVVAHTALLIRMRPQRITPGWAFGYACAIAVITLFITLFISVNVWGE
jgi:hypothetical protein